MVPDPAVVNRRAGNGCEPQAGLLMKLLLVSQCQERCLSAENFRTRIAIFYLCSLSCVAAVWVGGRVSECSLKKVSSWNTCHDIIKHPIAPAQHSGYEILVSHSSLSLHPSRVVVLNLPDAATPQYSSSCRGDPNHQLLHCYFITANFASYESSHCEYMLCRVSDT